MNRDIFHLDTLIVPHRYQDKMREGIAVIIAGCFFPVQKNFFIERWEKHGFIRLNE